jgi:hypothetical protein
MRRRGERLRVGAEREAGIAAKSKAHSVEVRAELHVSLLESSYLDRRESAADQSGVRGGCEGFERDEDAPKESKLQARLRLRLRVHSLETEEKQPETRKEGREERGKEESRIKG